MKRRIVYLMSGPAHVPYLVCSLTTLRRWWTGDVTVYAWPQSIELVERVADDDRLGIHCELRTPEYRGKNAQFRDKILLARSVDADEVMYLDADTTIHGEVFPLFNMVGKFGFVATQFNKWSTHGNIIGGRVRKMRGREGIDQRWVEEALRIDMPSVNGGVWACRPSSPVLPTWHEWTVEMGRQFIADEVALHAAASKYTASGELTIATGGQWNYSPKYGPGKTPLMEAIIMHYHGDSCVRPNKSQLGFEFWREIFGDCVKKNFGGMANWIGDTTNKWIKGLMKDGEL